MMLVRLMEKEKEKKNEKEIGIFFYSRERQGKKLIDRNKAAINPLSSVHRESLMAS